MKKLLALTVGACLAAAAQMADVIMVTLPRAAMVGTATLPAGVYTIRDLTDDGSSSSVLQIRSAKGATITAVVMRISEPNNKPADHSQVVLQRNGDTYQIDKIWLEGRDYGYELKTGIN